MYVDAWFAIGDTHVVCEDFACAGHTEGTGAAGVTRLRNGVSGSTARGTSQSHVGVAHVSTPACQR